MATARARALFLLLAASLVVSGCGEAPVADRYVDARRAFESFDREHSRVHGDLHYLDWRADASEDAVPLLYLHGTYSSAHEFAPFGEGLVAAGYAPIAVDWYGHGRTPLPSREVTLDALVEELMQLLDALAIERAIVVGHSRGGMIATALYDRAPERVSGLVLVDGGSISMERFFAGWSDDELDAFLTAAVDPETRRFRNPSYASERELFETLDEAFGRPEALEDLFWLLAAAHQGEDDRWYRTRVETLRWLDQESFEGARRGMRTPAQAPPFMADCTLLDPLEVYAELDVPILVLDATGDTMDWTPQNLELAALHPDSVEIRTYETGHYLFREKPGRFLQDLADFRSRVTPTSER